MIPRCLCFCSLQRKELEVSFRRSLGTRGRSPHFCNFVHKVDLHTRYDTGYARTGSGSDEEDGRDSLLSEGTDGDILAQWRKSRLSNSGTEGRPGSPTSLDGRPRDGDVTSFNNGGTEDEDALSVSLLVNHLVNSDGESVRRPESMMPGDSEHEGRRGRFHSKRKNSVSKTGARSGPVKGVISRHSASGG
ncbi:hypothetical protein ACOMHN_038362 [Nucella lapillus]